jgi:hypothetical protein
MPVHTTDEIGATINDSFTLRHEGTPNWVRIPAISNQLVRLQGVKVDDTSVLDDEHSKIITRMALTAFITGKQLQVEFDKIEFPNVWAKTVRIVSS